MDLTAVAISKVSTVCLSSRLNSHEAIRFGKSLSRGFLATSLSLFRKCTLSYLSMSELTSHFMTCLWTTSIKKFVLTCLSIGQSFPFSTSVLNLPTNLTSITNASILAYCAISQKNPKSCQASYDKMDDSCSNAQILCILRIPPDLLPSH